jgi:hypothetical protein
LGQSCCILRASTSYVRGKREEKRPYIGGLLPSHRSARGGDVQVGMLGSDRAVGLVILAESRDLAGSDLDLVGSVGRSGDVALEEEVIL